MGLELFSKRSRPQLFHELSSRHFDLLIIGGGITGASILREAALRGMNVALLEAKDFASGASSRSSKIIHGGLRYLKHRNFHLTWESCHERNLHVKLNPRLVRPWPFLIPAYRGRGESVAMLRLGMWLYEITSGFRNYRFHRFLSRDETLRQAPGLDTEGLKTGIVYYDAIVSDDRFTLETIKDGVRQGGFAVNHAPVIDLLKENGRVSGAVWRDELTGSTYETRADAVVNATGAWADRLRRLDKKDVSNLVQISKGTHLIFDEADVPLAVSTVFFSSSDKRPLFMIKRDGCYIFGTTDNWVESSPDSPGPDENEIAYLMKALAQYLPGSELDRNKVKRVYSGLRALPAGDAAGTDPSSVSREDVIEVSPSGLMTVIGGKLTTARLMADRVLKHVGNSGARKKSRTHKLPLNGSNEEVMEGYSRWASQYPNLKEQFLSMYQRYGLDAHDICGHVVENAAGAGPNSTAVSEAELEYVFRREMPCSLEDLMERRVGLLRWDNEERLDQLRSMKQAICRELEIDDAEFEKGYREYQDYLKRLHRLP